ncbi:MAG: endonuclease [Chloroflexi bacterium]|nr:endonuclease [Chloroflexota bacterium]
MTPSNRYSAIIESIFHAKHELGGREVPFNRDDITALASKLNIVPPANLGDVVYSFRYRNDLPASILAKAPKGETWIIRPAGRGKYRFELVADVPLAPNLTLAVTKIPDATPGIISKYAFSDEQSLLARVRYNRLIDVFLGIACYSLQNHLRTTVAGMGQVETDEIYVGVDKSGSHYVVPVQAKGGSDKLSRVQIEQDIAVCVEKLPSLICRPIGAQFMKDGLIALFEFEQQGEDIRVASEKHYQLVPPESVTDEDLLGYRQRLSDRT